MSSPNSPKGECPKCRYAMNPGRCPECGDFAVDVTPRRLLIGAEMKLLAVLISVAFVIGLATGFLPDVWTAWATRGIEPGPRIAAIANRARSFGLLFATAYLVVCLVIIVRAALKRLPRQPVMALIVLCFGLLSVPMSIFAGLMIQFIVRHGGDIIPSQP